MTGVPLSSRSDSQTSRPSQSAGGTRRPDSGAVYLGLAGGLFVASAVLGGAYFFLGTSSSVAIAATESRPAAPEGSAAAALSGSAASALDAMLAAEVEVKAGAVSHHLRWSELGVEADPDQLERLGKSDAAGLAAAGALPLRVNRDRAVAALTALKGKVDRAPVDARLDLEARKVADEQAGTGIDVFGSLGRIEGAARSASPSVELATVALPARVTRATLGIEDISHVLGTFKTQFAVSDKERNFNLKLAASKLNGYVLLPGAEFSFNTVVGDRTEKEGYKIAHVITAGEMVDGLAGGTCQISTTLFGASFFAGLEVIRSLPHSRPSTYVTMGLDSTVVYPTVDLKMKNPYDFPVVIHYRVTRGEAMVEILGEKRPWTKVVFEREVEEEVPYTSTERPDETLPIGYVSLDQPGFNGYKLMRYRKFFKGNRLVKTDKWKLEYKPVTEYLRVGTNADPLAEVPAEEKQHHMPKAPKQGNGYLAQ